MANSAQTNQNNQHIDYIGSRRLSVAPMLDWTDTHYRYLARQITRHTWLYTEMVHAGAVVYGDAARFLDKNDCEHPLALQLGGCKPALLARAAQRAAQWGYDEINLNCGCPSPKVQQGAFGACLMGEVALVADCLNAMQEAAPDAAVTVKHRIGIDRQTDYQVVTDFVGTLAERSSCRTFIVHARNAWLDGLSPKENREIPPLKYDYVYRLKRDFPQLEIILNGGVTDNQAIAGHLQHVDGVMVGRASYHHPMLMREWDRLFFGDAAAVAIDHAELVARLYDYAATRLAAGNGTSLRHMVRHYLGLMHGLPGARQWRRLLSDATLLQQNDARLINRAWAAVTQATD